jgi:hypothetical protein
MRNQKKISEHISVRQQNITAVLLEVVRLTVTTKSNRHEENGLKKHQKAIISFYLHMHKRQQQYLDYIATFKVVRSTD